MDHFCHFHPNSPARWQCSGCHRLFDHACTAIVNQHPARSLHADCPLCGCAMSLLDSQASMESEPVLLRHYLFTGPISLLVTAVTLLAAASVLTKLPLPLLYLLNQAAVFFTCFHYGRLLTFSKAYSDNRAASIRKRNQPRSKNASGQPTLKTSLQAGVALGTLFSIPAFVFYQTYWFTGILLMLIISALVPYLLLTIIHQYSAHDSFSLKKLFATLAHKKYLLSWQTLMMFFGALIITDFTHQLASPPIALIVSSAVSSVFFLILLQRHVQVYQQLSQKLASAPKKSDTSEARYAGPNSDTQSKQSSSELELQLKSGQYSNAVALLERQIKHNPHASMAKQQLYLLLSELNDLVKLTRYSELFLSMMLERGKVREASKLLYRLRKHDPAYRLHNIDLISELAKQFARANKHALVVWLAEGCNQRFKPSDSLASLYLSASQVLVTHFKDLAKAEEYLLFVITECSGFSSTEAAKALLIHLNNNQSRQQSLRE